MKIKNILFLFFICAIFLLITLVPLNIKAQSISQNLQNSTIEIDDIYTIYLPSLLKNYPRTNVFGITMAQLTEAQGIIPIAEAGTTWTRRSLNWAEIEPIEGQRNWNTNFEQELIRANNLGIRTILIIENTPSWALKPGFNCGPVASDKFPLFGNFVYDTVKRYSVEPYNVQYWELWNEPDVAGFLGCWGDPNDKKYYGGKYYGQMLTYVYTKFKEANPLSQVLVGGLLLDCDPNNPPSGRTCVESKFLQGILEAGGGPYFDGVSFHAYDYYRSLGQYGNSNWNSSSNANGPVSIKKSEYLTDILNRYGVSSKYLLNTETALFYGPNVDYPLCVEDAPPELEETKAYYVIHSYATSVAYKYRANIWYAAFGGRCAAMFNSDLSPLPAFNAYRFAINKLEEANFIRDVTEFSGIMGYEFQIPGRKLWVIWSKDGLDHPITLPKEPVLINKVGPDGIAVQIANTVSLTVGLSPYFIEFSN